MSASEAVPATFTDDEGAPVDMPCQWFARCVRPARWAVSHPALEWVPCCDECAAFATE